jgi:DNA-binding LacI/PurR family transcriptional regulator
VVNMANPSPGLLAREQAFVAHAAAHGAAAIVVRAGHSDYAGGQEGAGHFLASGQAPEAVFCVNDLMAFGALDRLRGAGLRVPADVSVIGFDDVPMAGWASYSLTTLRQDPARIAGEVVAILDRRSAEPEMPPVSVSFPVDLVVRETVRGMSR